MYCVKVFCLAYFTLPTVYKDYTHCSVLQCLMSLYGCTTSHCICTPQFMYLFIWYSCSLNALSPQNSCWNLSRPARNVTVYKNKSQHSSTEDKQTSLMWHRIWRMGMQGDRRCTHRVRSTRNGAWRNSPAWLLPLAGKLGSALCWQGWQTSEFESGSQAIVAQPFCLGTADAEWCLLCPGLLLSHLTILALCAELRVISGSLS